MITTIFTGTSVVNFFVTAEDPAGPWSEPVRVDAPGIDPDLAWDDDGNCWVHFSGGGIQRLRIDDRTGDVLDGPTLAWPGTGLQFPEAPHLFRRGNWWYLLIAEGGTERGHAVTIARGPSPTGPWESCPANPILSHRSTDRPIQNTGHADLVEATDGSWWMVLLGTRPRGMTPMFHVVGRETFLVPVDWVDEWPLPRDLALDMPERPPGSTTPDTPAAARDDFDGAVLAPQWVSVRGPLSDAASLTERPRAADAPRGRRRPRRVCGRCSSTAPARRLRCRARTRVEVGDAAEAGLAVRMDERHRCEVAVAAGEVVVRARIGPLAGVISHAAAPGGALVLRVQTHDDPTMLGAGPDHVRSASKATTARSPSSPISTGGTSRPR